jgi:hypothetical protein
MQVGVFNLTELTSLWQEVRNSKNVETYCNILQENQPAPKIIEVIQERNTKKTEKNYQSLGRIMQEHPMYEDYLMRFCEQERAEQNDKKQIEILEKECRKIGRLEKITRISANGRNTWLLLYTATWKELSQTEIQFAYLNRKLRTETVRIEHEITNNLYRIESPERVKHWVSEIQNSLLNEAMELLAQNNQNIPLASELIKTEYNQKELESLTLYYLNQVILKLKRKYGHHFSEEVNECLRIYAISINELRREIAQLKKAISTWEDPKLGQLIQSQIQVVEDFIKGDFISLQEFTYAKAVIHDIVQKCWEKEGMEWNSRKMRYLLLYHNFNHLDFIAWLTNNFRYEMNKFSNPWELKQWLLKEQKKIKQIIPHSNRMYKSGIPGAKELITTWIQEELLYIDGIHAANPEQLIYQPVNDKQEQKLTTTLNVPQLALFAALLVEEGIIQEKNKTHVFSAFSNVFKTKHQSSIAVTSLRNNYYDKDPKNMTVLKTKLIQMINRLNISLNSNESFSER